MIILGIDTSCDDTAIALLAIKTSKSKTKLPKFKILANIVSSQVKLHSKYGGVYPMLAKREHQRNLPLVLKKSLAKAKIKKPDVIAVTVGPGLEPCLWQGINFAVALAKKWQKEIISINHIEGHLLAWMLKEPGSLKPILPAIALIVSGGHTQLILMNKVGNYKIIGETRDDAAGECFDKTARILGLGYPGGPAIAAKAGERTSAKNEDLPSIRLPRPMFYSKDYDFSFSGLKTAVLYDYKSRPNKIKKSQAYIRAMAQEIQQAIIDCLIKKTIRAAENFKTKTIILGGGVSANRELKKQMQEVCRKRNITFIAPSAKLATDNGLMIALAGWFNRSKKTKKYDMLKAEGSLRL